MNRLRYWLLALALLLTPSVILVTTRESHRRRVTKANFEKIKKGMSYQEVTAILGLPRNLVGPAGAPVFFADTAPLPPWEWERVTIEVYFRPDPWVVEGAHCNATKKTWAEWLQGWRDWAGL